MMFDRWLEIEERYEISRKSEPELVSEAADSVNRLDRQQGANQLASDTQSATSQRATQFGETRA